MKARDSRTLVRWLMLASFIVPVAVTGCQTTVGGQTLPSGYYLEDDVQYSPAGPEFILHNTETRMKQYTLGTDGGVQTQP